MTDSPDARVLYTRQLSRRALTGLLRLQPREYGLALQMLEEAPRLIQSEGWLRHGRRSGFCPVVALYHLAHELEVGGAVHTACSLAYRLAIGWRAIAPWNDEPGRTREEVLAAFAQAAEYLILDEVAP